MRIVTTLTVLFASLVTLNCDAGELQMNKTMTYCIGRYLVDLPADAQINGQTYDYKYGQVRSRSVDEVEFQQQVAQREGELLAGKHSDGYKLKNVLRLTPTAWIFELERQLLMGPSVGFEAHRWIDNQAFELSQVDTRQGKYAEVISTIKTDVFPRLRGRHAHEMLTEPGFCLKDGFIADDGKVSQFESTGIGFEFAKWPGVLVTVQTVTVTQLGQPKLLERLNMDDVPERFRHLVSKIRTIRRGERTINGRAGEEDLSTVPTGHGYSVHQFRWESQGSHVSDALEPTLIVELDSGMTRDGDGNPVRPRLTDEEAVAVFDAVSTSLRFRSSESGVPITGDVHPSPDLPLGTLAQTGTACPQTGWWTCPEATANEIEGGRRQWFEAGAVMPVAQVLGKQSMIDRLTGRREKYGVNTVWKLVAYDRSEGDGQSSGYQSIAKDH